MKKTLLIIFTICFSYLNSQAQHENYILYNPIHLGFGLTGGLGLHSTNTTLRCIGDPACPTYDGGVGSQFGFMGNVEWMPTDWGMRGSIGFSNGSVEMSTIDSRALVKDVNGVIVPLVREHSLNISLPMINMDLGLQKSFGNSRVFFGPSFGFLLSPNWKSTSTLLSPNNVTFSSGSRDTVFLDQAIPNVNSLQYGISMGYGHHIPISKKVVIVPEISASIPFSRIIAGPEWKQTSILIGMSIRWGMGAVKEEVIRRAEVIDTIEVNVNERIGSLIIEGQKKSTKSIEEFETHKIITETIQRTDTLKVGLPPKVSPKPFMKAHIAQDEESEEVDAVNVRGQLVTEAFPILPMVFFSEADANLHPRYRQLRTIEGFASDKLDPFVSEQHKDILNIIGERMNKNMQAKIELHGFSDPTTENSNCELAGKRVGTVREYLANVWNIDRSRITIKMDNRRCSPENPTMSRIPQGYEENRRIEIISEQKEILAPVIRSRYVEITEYSPKDLFINASRTIGENINSWKLSSQLGDSVLHVKDGAQIPLWIQLPIEKEDARLMQQSMNDQLQMSMIIQDSEGDLGSTEMSIPIQRDTTNYAIQRLSLMHFPVQKATLDRQGRNAIDAFLQDLEDNASISIIGYSDNLGNAQSNLELSKERAETVYKYIRSIKPKSNIVKVNGLGSTALPPGIRSHELPESRFLSRTVQIEIIRTWKNLE
jgi:outer membrane protein OmpA-like peptidoglycan-associated protein